MKYGQELIEALETEIRSSEKAAAERRARIDNGETDEAVDSLDSAYDALEEVISYIEEAIG